MAEDHLDLNRFFNPKSVALVGASKDPEKRSGAPLRILLNADYQGKIYPVNPKYDQLKGVQCYPSVKDISGEVDLALILLPAPIVPEILSQCADKGVKFAIVISAGWAEIGEEGLTRQNKLEVVVKSSNMRISGPNCLGMVGFKNKAAATFYNFKDFSLGSVGLISQSGALAGLAKFKAESRSIHFSYWVTGGNEVDLTTLDYAEFMIDDPDTDVIGAYLEGVNDGDRFRALATKAVNNEVPILALKVGSSQIGKEAAKTHTATLAGSDTAYRAFFRQHGIIQVASIDEMLDLASFISNYGIPKGLQLGIVSYSGGAATNLADSCEKANLKIPRLNSNVQDSLSSVLEERVVLRNPLDLAGGIEPPGYDQIIYALAKQDNIDLIVFMIGWWGNRAKDSWKSIKRATKKIDKPVVIIWPTPDDLTESGINKLEQNDLTVFPSIPRCIRTLKQIKWYRDYLTHQRRSWKSRYLNQNSKQRPNLFSSIDSNRRSLTEFESKKILQHYDIPVTNERMTTSVDKAVRAAQDIGYPVALKVQSPEISHKTDAKVIRLNIKNKSQLTKSYKAILPNAEAYKPDAQIKGVLVQEMVDDSGAEVILGMNKDKVFGPLMMFGLGGVFAEILNDVSFGVAPLTDREIKAMVKEIKGHEILEDARGRDKLDIPSLINIIKNFSRLIYDHKSFLKEIDINPLVVFPKGNGVKVVDALITLDRDGNQRTRDQSSTSL